MTAHTIGAIRKVVAPEGYRLLVSGGGGGGDGGAGGGGAAAGSQQKSYYTVPCGSYVAVSHILPHLNADVFPSPESFRPERFLAKKKTKAKAKANDGPGNSGHGGSRGAGDCDYENDDDDEEEEDDDDDEDDDGVWGSAAAAGPYELTSFSHGVHVCPGRRYALVLVKLIVAFALDGPLSDLPRPSFSTLDFSRATLAQRSARVRVDYAWKR